MACWKSTRARSERESARTQTTGQRVVGRPRTRRIEATLSASPRASDERAQQAQGQYLYAIIACAEPREFKARGMGRRGNVVHTMNYRQLAAVVSNSPNVEYENSRRNMMAHTLVLEEVMEQFTLLPVRFGTIAPDAGTEDSVTRLLRVALRGISPSCSSRCATKSSWASRRSGTRAPPSRRWCATAIRFAGCATP